MENPQKESQQKHVGQVIKVFYFYAVSIIALFMIVFSVADLLNIGLRTYVFPKADSNYYGYYPEPACPMTSNTSTPAKDFCVSKEDREKADAESRSAQRQRDLVRDISILLVGVPLFAYHWMIVRRKEV